MDGDKKVVLVIDDMMPSLKTVEAILEPHYDVKLSTSGGTAINLIGKIKVDIILLDIEMPGMSGFEFLHWIRKDPKYMNIPVIIISSFSTEDFFSHAAKEGADLCIPKPVDPGDLLQKVQTLLDNPPKHSFFGL
jgi:CheY-like chemotaxis protein